jgi:glycosyltransferase involved in cell wall biosynthesis
MNTSICIPTFNGARFIGETLQSIAAQTCLPKEVVISDDGSTDNTLEIISSVSRAFPVPIRIFRNPGRGPTRNYLSAVSHAVGDIIMLADHDDVMDKRRVELVTVAFTASPQVLLFSSDSEIVGPAMDPAGTTIRGGYADSVKLSERLAKGDDFGLFLRGGLPFLAHTLAFRSSMLDLVLKWPEQIHGFWMEEWVTAVCAAFGRIGALPDALTKYRQHPGQLAGATGRAQNSTTSDRQSDVILARLEKMRFLRMTVEQEEAVKVLAPNDRLRKAARLSDYCEFLEFRLRMRAAQFGSGLSRSRTFKNIKDYFVYSSGLLSFGSDLAQCVRSWLRS